MNTERLITTIQKAKQGDINAFEELYLDVHKSIYRFALRMLKNPEDAEDIAQEVYITIQQKITELREPAAFYAWANQITANKCNRLLSKYKGISKFDDEKEFLALVDDDPANMPDKALDNEATRKIINEVIDNLPDKQSICILMFYYAQLTVVQIAEALDTNENTVKSRLALGRAKIQAALEEKAKKDGIKLWGIPLALTPILREFIAQMPVPEGLSARMWENIQQSIAEGMQADNPAQADITATHADNPGTTLGQVDPGCLGEQQAQLATSPKLATDAASAVMEAASTAASAGMTAATKFIIGCVAVAVITACVYFIPQLIDIMSDPMPPIVADTVAHDLAHTTVNSPFVSLTAGDIIQFGGHDWRVLEVQDGKALILSEQTLLSREDFGENGLTWENSNMRRYLNTTFYNTFNEDERVLIAETRVVTNNNLWHGTTGGNDTTDRIFLLSMEEVLNYFGDSGQIYLGPEISTDPVPALSDQYNRNRIARNASGAATFWWLRSPGFNSGVNIFIRMDGTVVMGGAAGINSHGMRLYDVRPALWLYTGTPPEPTYEPPTTADTETPEPTHTLPTTTPAPDDDTNVPYVNAQTEDYILFELADIITITMDTQPISFAAPYTSPWRRDFPDMGSAFAPNAPIAHFPIGTTMHIQIHAVMQDAEWTHISVMPYAGDIGEIFIDDLFMWSFDGSWGFVSSESDPLIAGSSVTITFDDSNWMYAGYNTIWLGHPEGWNGFVVFYIGDETVITPQDNQPSIQTHETISNITIELPQFPGQAITLTDVYDVFIAYYSPSDSTTHTFYLRESGTVSFSQAITFYHLHGDGYDFHAGQIIEARGLNFFMHSNNVGDIRHTLGFQTFPTYTFDGDFYETLNTASIMNNFYEWSQGTDYRAAFYPIINLAVD